ncbi:signal transduction histidine kinase [Isoptericola jiangsuensis]|uniref:histidine kinase n=1 Tax=Isoptericola jiangsuensis TaxID=548579 RepID=A0A2A9F219_9MICO|nr:sensor histidine kinase [Isoptericola jiangsuensis]PFG44582.1 signal transduction histidine kinase [Isoptericola jiangsuensis]
MTIPDLTASRVAPALTDLRGLRRAPWDRATYDGVAQVVVGWFWLLVVGLPLLVVVITAASLVPALGIGLLVLPLALGLARGFAAVERSRLAAQTGVVIPAPPRREPRRPGWWSWLWAQLADGRSWLAAAYLLVGLVAYSVLLVLVVAAPAAAVAALALGARSVAAGDLVGLLAVPAAVLLVWTAAVVAQLGDLVTVLLARALVGPSVDAEARAAQQAAERQARTAEAEARAAESVAATARERADVLTATRAAALEAADTERRRIERDLHDGVQQRLVALGVALGTARREAERDPATAVAALDHAHGEVKESLAELRDLVRGIHPAVLADRGLDAALSALAARSPVPVRVEAGPGLERAGTTAQAAAYFVVAEALTNVARHADARGVVVRADVVEDTDGGRLRVEVADDGRGGAEPAPGSGLAGLRGRVAALDGTFDLTSPTGAGTRLTVEVPCAS